jgi:uncharacterized protein with GYD domain
MLFMTIYTFSPENREAVIKRRVEKGGLVPAGAKVISEWSSLTGHRVFRVIEVEDPKAMLAATLAWSDLGNIESYAIMPMEEVLKVIAAKK